jgi:hypothetical protein
MVDQLERYGGSAGEVWWIMQLYVWWISWTGRVDQLERYMVDQLERYGGSAGEVWWISWRGMVDQLERMIYNSPIVESFR